MTEHFAGQRYETTTDSGTGEPIMPDTHEQGCRRLAEAIDDSLGLQALKLPEDRICNTILADPGLAVLVEFAEGMKHDRLSGDAARVALQRFTGG